VSDRQANLAKIHIAKKQLGMEEDTYRDFLKGLTGKRSAAGMNPREHIKVIAEFEKLGFAKKTNPNRGAGKDVELDQRPKSTKNEIESLIRMIKKLVHQVSRANNEPLALRRRLFKFRGVTDLEQLSLEQLKEVYADLQRVAYRGRW
jgi:phage gp16-like protein